MGGGGIQAMCSKSFFLGQHLQSEVEFQIFLNTVGASYIKVRPILGCILYFPKNKKSTSAPFADPVMQLRC